MASIRDVVAIAALTIACTTPYGEEEKGEDDNNTSEAENDSVADDGDAMDDQKDALHPERSDPTAPSPFGTSQPGTTEAGANAR